MNLTSISHDVPALQKNSAPHAIQKVQLNTDEHHQTANHDSELRDPEKEKQQVKSTVDKLNEFNDPVYTNLQFVFHEELEKYYVTVVNPNTDEVIREIPPKKMLDMYAEMAEYMGLLVDEKI